MLIEMASDPEHLKTILARLDWLGRVVDRFSPTVVNFLPHYGKCYDEVTDILEEMEVTYRNI